jgi:hydrogenase maturation protein HypF
MTIERLQIAITGQVQGVGFRPHAYQIALALNLSGWVQNNGAGVLIEVQGKTPCEFLKQLKSTLPPLARIDTIQTRQISLIHEQQSFTILASQPGNAHTIIAPDTATCGECLNELFDPKSRYYHYPFLNCTHCGPRLTITHALPYDRAQTSMCQFPLCKECQAAFNDPGNRRYHAQPTACTHCGPQLSCDINTIVQALKNGKIVAIKGLGGYQLIADAHNQETILTLRLRKNREQKPFAIMVKNEATAADIAEVDEEAKQLLTSAARPIVLLKKQKCLPEAIAPNLSHFGLMLPSTPIHHLLFEVAGNELQALIVTSANISGNPLIMDDKTAKRELSAIADRIVTCNRQIVTRADDSVVRIINNAPVFIRRAKGFIPERIKLPHPIPTTLALGAHLKNTFCITRDDEAFVSQHIGSLNNRETIEFLHESIRHWQNLLNVTIERVASDLHPDFYTTQLAHDFNLPVVPVQHHHAHLASVAAEHHILQPAIGLALDGYGYGTDGRAWGGELLLLDSDHFERLGHFQPLPLPGGETAVREPWRMAAAILHKLNRNEHIHSRFSEMPQAHWVANMLKNPVNMPLTTSCGRLFDAASALLGLTTLSHYEGQAAMELESLVTHLEVLPNGWAIDNNEFSLLPTFSQLLSLNPVAGANLFHGTLVAGLAEWLITNAKHLSITTILLSGGCFLNKVLSEGLYNHLTQSGLKVYLPQRVPPNDGGLSLGQAWIAGTKRIDQCV